MTAEKTKTKKIKKISVYSFGTKIYQNKSILVIGNWRYNILDNWHYNFEELTKPV